MNKKNSMRAFIAFFTFCLLVSTASGQNIITLPDMKVPPIELEDLSGFLGKQNTKPQNDLTAIAKLASEIKADSDAYSHHPKKHYIYSASIKTSDESAYMEKVYNKLQNAAKKLPKRSLQQHSNKRVIVAFTLDKQGNLIDSKISKSSEVKKLDSALLEIIKKESPYQPFSKKMSQSYDQLNIVRTFMFKQLL